MPKRKLPLRPNVCMLLYNKKGELFLGERINKRAHWQFPQGGAEKRYSLRENVVRELKEELGIPRRTLGSIRKLAATHEYDWAKIPAYASGKWRGQSQTFWMVEFVGNDSDIDRCLGEMLSEPRQNVVFNPPRRMDAARFAAAIDRRGARLDMKTRMLFDRARFYINGESFSAAKQDAKILRVLADTRELAAGVRLSPRAMQLLHDWHAAGYLQLGTHRPPLPARARR